MEEKFLNSYCLQSTARGTGPRSSVFVKSEGLLKIMAAARETGFQLLIWDCPNILQKSGREVLSSGFPFAMLQSASASQMGALYVWYPGFPQPVLTFCSCPAGDAPRLPGCDGQGGLQFWVPQDCDDHRDGSWQSKATESRLK